MKKIRTFPIVIAALTVLLIAGPARPQEKPSVSLSYNRFYSYDEIKKIFQDLEKKYPQFLSVSSLGKSVQGRDMLLMTINNPKTGAEMDKPAMYIDANIHGNEVQGGGVVIYTIDYLMTNYNRIERVKKLVDECVFYLIPTVNPDGRSHWFDTKNFGSGGRSGMAPYDNDNDGLYDEDGYDDLDGDGLILRMRKKVEHGDYKLDPNDPRIMERVPRGETGDYILLGMEGIDNDGDGRINEDGPGGYDMNRNWPADWQPNYVQSGAGTRPFSYPETESIGKFLLSHPNIAGMQSYHNSGGMILRGPGDQSQGTYPYQDQAVYDQIGRTGEKILPFYHYYVIWKDLYAVHGGSIDWAAEGLGIFSFSNELWSSSQYYNTAGPEESRSEGYSRRQEERLFFDDHVEMGSRFVEWKPFHHPVYGDVELGGWVRETNRVPPLFMQEELCHRNAMFTLYHAEQLPQVAIGEISKEQLGTDTWRVRVEFRNNHIIPTIGALAAQRHLVRPDIITVKGSGITVASSSIVDDVYLNITEAVPNRPERIELQGGIPGNNAVICEFILKGRGKALVSLDTAKGGKASKEIKID